MIYHPRFFNVSFHILQIFLFHSLIKFLIILNLLLEIFQSKIKRYQPKYFNPSLNEIKTLRRSYFVPFTSLKLHYKKLLSIEDDLLYIFIIPSIERRVNPLFHTL